MSAIRQPKPTMTKGVRHAPEFDRLEAVLALRDWLVMGVPAKDARNAGSILPGSGLTKRNFAVTRLHV